MAILYLDDDLAVVDKPPGIVVHPGWAQDGGGLVRVLREQLGRAVWPVHRLDRGASGALAFALSAEAAAVLGRAFAAGLVDKRYLALVRGHPPEEVVVDHPVPSRPDGPRVAAVTEIRRLGVWGRYALVEARPRTGRLHQIRRHLKHLSCPIIGDANYGKGPHNRFFREEHGLDRLALHAHHLSLPHPTSGAPIVTLAPPSGSLARCLEAIGLRLPQDGARLVQSPTFQSEPEG
jgi:tRNA pseudouridine65 synthase